MQIEGHCDCADFFATGVTCRDCGLLRILLSVGRTLSCAGDFSYYPCMVESDDIQYLPQLKSLARGTEGRACWELTLYLQALL